MKFLDINALNMDKGQHVTFLIALLAWLLPWSLCFCVRLLLPRFSQQGEGSHGRLLTDTTQLASTLKLIRSYSECMGKLQNQVQVLTMEILYFVAKWVLTNISLKLLSGYHPCPLSAF